MGCFSKTHTERGEPKTRTTPQIRGLLLGVSRPLFWLAFKGKPKRNLSSWQRYPVLGNTEHFTAGLNGVGESDAEDVIGN